MMNIQMNPEQARVIGCLMEKAVTTPDQYPLTLNALTNACNQKSSREPVMNLTPGTVQHIVRQLQEKFLIKNNENFKSGIDKYEQRLCNTPMTDCRLSPAEYAIVCLAARDCITSTTIRLSTPFWKPYSTVKKAHSSLACRSGQGAKIMNIRTCFTALLNPHHWIRSALSGRPHRITANYASTSWKSESKSWKTR